MRRDSRVDNSKRGGGGGGGGGVEWIYYLYRPTAKFSDKCGALPVLGAPGSYKVPLSYSDLFAICQTRKVVIALPPLSKHPIFKQAS